MASPYTLPDLPYDYAALEPHISGEIMQLHHDRHHRGYVTGANTALERLAEAREAQDFARVNLFEQELAFNLAGHVNHSVFWPNMSPHGGDKPDGELAAAIDEHFGSFGKFQAQFTAVATSVKASGWAMLSWDPLGGRLVIQRLYDHQGNHATGSHPLLMLDMWEHAYYLQYYNAKADYVAAWWNVVNWADVAKRFEVARSVRIS